MKMWGSLWSLIALQTLATSDRLSGLPEKLDEVTLEQWTASGAIPSWLRGKLCRQLCGGIAPATTSTPNNLLDCMGMIGVLNINGAYVSMSTKYYPTQGYQIWSAAGKSFAASNVGWITKISDVSQAVYDTKKDGYKSAYPGNPNLDFWKVDNRILAVDDEFQG